MKELVKIVSESTLNNKSDNPELVNEIDLFLRNTNLLKNQKEKLIELIDRAFMSGYDSCKNNI